MGATFAIIEAPSSLGLTTDGVEELGTALLHVGLKERIGARMAARLETPPKDPVPDPATNVLNSRIIAEWSLSLAAAVTQVLNKKEFPVVLGGDCTILLGSMLALRRAGRYGLLFIDGHADFFQSEAEPNSEGASMELAWVTGRGPTLLTNIGGLLPLVRAEDAVAFGYRDHDDQAEYGSQPLPPELLAFDLPILRSAGIEPCARAAIEHLTRAELDGFFIHLDADVLDDAVMPAVDYRMAAGLSWSELASLLRIALASEKAVGIEVTIYNPQKDVDGSAGHGLADVLTTALREK